MKTHVNNIFRKPLTYKSSSSPTSIFRRHNNNQQQQPLNSSESESYVVSCPATPKPTTDDQQQWPPHQAALSNSSIEVGTAVDKSTLNNSQSPSTPNKLDRCNPLPTQSETSNSFNVQSIFGTTDSFNIDSKSSPERNSSPLSSSKRSLRSLSNSSKSPKGSPSSKSLSSRGIKKLKPPSYYKLQFSKSKDKASLTSGDDLSIQIDETHNLQIRLATTNDCCDSTIGESSRSVRESMKESRERIKISRASPICEDTSSGSAGEGEDNEEGIEYDALNNVVITPDFGNSSTTAEGGEGREGEKMKHKWTVNSQGQIIIVPPSPTHIASEQLITKKARHHSPVKEMVVPSSKVEVTPCTTVEQPTTMMRSNINQPLLMTVSNDSSSNDSFISSGEEETLEGTTFLTPLPATGSAGSSNLESPPRMTRHSRAFGTAYHSLFRGDESDGSRSSGNNAAANKNSGSLPSSSGKRRQRSISPNSKGSKTSSEDTGGCTSILTQILDVFSLNGNMCCHQEVSSSNEGEGDYLRQHSQQAQRGVLICA